MSSTAPQEFSSTQGTGRKRAVGKTLLKLIIVAAAGIGAWEWYVGHCFQRSYAALEKAINKPGEYALRRDEIGSRIAGNPRRTENDNTIVYVWSSLFQKKALRLRSKSQTQIVEISLGTENFPEDLDDPRKRKFVADEEKIAARKAANLKNLSPPTRYRPVPGVKYSDKIYQIPHLAPKYADHIRLMQFPMGGLGPEFKNVVVADLFDREYFHYDGGNHYGGSLIREIGRQAFLMSAREELGLQTRDRTLREETRIHPDPVNWPFTVLSMLDQEGNVKIGILQLTDIDWVIHWEKKFELPPEKMYEGFATAMEGYARTEFPALLTKAGFKANVRKRRALNPECLPRIEKHLAHLNEFSQFIAVQELHREIQEAGETPELLQGLVRGYAHLGVLTQNHWNSGPKVFLARSLLYAERLLAKTKSSPSALRHRAYVRALVGLQASALADLDAAAKQAGDQGASADQDWVPTLRAFVTADEDALQQIAAAEETRRPLAQLLKLLYHEVTFQDESIRDAASKLRAAAPDCFRARYLPTVGNVSGTSSTPTEDETLLVNSVYKLLAELPDLPPTIREKIERLRRYARGRTVAAEEPGPAGVPPQGGEGLWGRLLKGTREALRKIPVEKQKPVQPVPNPAAIPDDDADDSELKSDLVAERSLRLELILELRKYGRSPADHSEPSLATFAYLLQELSFLIIRSNAEQSQRWSAATLSRETEGLYQLLDGHPMRDVVPAVFDHANNNRQAAARTRLLDAVEPEEIEGNAWLAVQAGKYADNNRGNDLQNHSLWHRDPFPHDYGNFLWNYSGLSDRSFLAFLSSLKNSAPLSPTVVYFTIARNPEVTRGQLTQWERKFRGSVPIQMQLAERHRKARRFDDAERCYLRCFGLSKTFAVLRPLAEMYRQKGDTSRWLQTLQEALEYPAEFLEHAHARTEIAKYYLDRDDVQTAKTFAEAAARSGAAWAMLLAGRVCERLGEWEQAENYYRSTSQNYSDMTAVWYLWCLRTGRGDVNGARAVVEQYAQRSSESYDKQESAVHITILVATGHTRQALIVASDEMQRSPSNWSGWQAVILGQELQDHKLRDLNLQMLVSRWETSSNPLARYAVDLARLIQQDLTVAGNSQLDLPSVERLVNRLPDELLAEQWYFLGSYLELRGRKDEARKYMEWCVGCPDPKPYEATSQVLAARWLLNRGVAVPAIRRDNHVKLPFSAGGAATVQVLQEPQGDVWDLQFAANGNKLLAGIENHPAQMWDLSRDISRLKTTVGEEGQSGLAQALAPDGRQLVISRSGTANLFVWDAESGTRQRPLVGHGSAVQQMAYSPDGQTLAVYYLSNAQNPDDQGDITLWDLATSREVRRIPIQAASVQFLRFHPDGKQLIAGIQVQGKRNLGRIIKWSVSSGKGTTLADEPDVKFTQGMLSGDGRRLLTRSSTGALRVRDTAKGTLLASTYLRNGADGIALSLNGELAACGMADGTIRLWDIRSGRERLPLEGHLRRVNSLAFSPDGKRLASGSDDMTIRIWNLEQLNPEKLTVAPPSGPLLSATVNSLGMSFVNIPAGEFRMGESQEDAGMNYYVGEFRLDQERPVIRVRLTRGFEMAQHELTVSQFREFVQATKFQTDAERDGGHRGLPPGDGMPRGGDRALTWRSPGFPQTDDHPVVQVSWNDATAFCEWLSRKEGVVYRLPTEAEWEYACRAGTSTMWTFGNDHNLVGEHANSADATILEHISQYAIASWYEDGFPFTAPAGSFAPNPFGLYDMHGNVGEWCYDDYQPFYYRVSSGIDPRSQAHINGASPVFRGGAFSLPDYRCRSASRAYGYHEAGISYVGIRLVREIRVPAR